MTRKRKNPPTKRRIPGPQDNLKDQDPRVVCAGVLALYRPLLRGLRPANADKRLYTLTIATLAATKLMLMLWSRGEKEFRGSPKVWQDLEEMSDDLAEETFQVLRKDIPYLDTVPGVRLTGERQYLHMVKGRTTYYWSKERIADGEPVPPRMFERLEGTQAGVYELLCNIVIYLGQRHAAAAGDDDARKNEVLAQVVGTIGISKFLLALFGNGKEAAALEQLAEAWAEREYEKLKEE